MIKDILQTSLHSKNYSLHKQVLGSVIVCSMLPLHWSVTIATYVEAIYGTVQPLYCRHLHYASVLIRDVSKFQGQMNVH